MVSVAAYRIIRCVELLPQFLSDNRASDLTKEGMLKGIEEAAAFVLFLSPGVLQRHYCQMEIRHALALKKPVVLLHESDARFGGFDFRAAHAEAAPDLQELLDNHESLPFRRRGYERDGMLNTMVERGGGYPNRCSSTQALCLTPKSASPRHQVSRNSSSPRAPRQTLCLRRSRLLFLTFFWTRCLSGLCRLSLWNCYCCGRKQSASRAACSSTAWAARARR